MQVVYQSTDIRLLQTICEFSDFFGVSRPKSSDLKEWWDTALMEMDKDSLYFLYEMGFCKNSPYKVGKAFRQRLEDRVKELNLH